MKKTMRGKRHLRARESVGVARREKKIRKARIALSKMKSALIRLGRGFEELNRAIEKACSDIVEAYRIRKEFLQ